MSQTLYHKLSRLALAKAIKTPDESDPYSEPWSKSIIFTQPFAVELQKQAHAFDMNQRTKSQRKPRKQYTCLSSDSEDNTDESASEIEIVPTKYRQRNRNNYHDRHHHQQQQQQQQLHQQHQRNHHHQQQQQQQQQQYRHREGWKLTKGHSRGSNHTLSSSTDGSSVDERNKKYNVVYEDQDPYYRKNRPMMDPVYYQNQQHMHAIQQQQAALEKRKTKTARVTNTDVRRRAEMMRNTNDNKQPATPMPRSRYKPGPGWTV